MNERINIPKINLGGDHSMVIATIADTLNSYALEKLEIFKKTNIVNIDITGLNMEIGTNKEAKISGKNTLELFKKFLN